ncbi:MAG: helix-turn-helix domain-containing protein [Actinomycetota bacterium]|nr:helix-turn-helix domain-containing protein [Actinomycetota bacterium]
MVDALVALHHPMRRRLYELLLMEGPASVGRLSTRSGLAPGSVSHHLKPLHRSGFITPAPDLAGDTRQSWWRPSQRSLSWETDSFEPGTVAYQVGQFAVLNNLSHQDRATAAWMRTQGQLPPAWRHTSLIQDSFVRATPEQSHELGRRLQQAITDWRLECEQQPSPDEATRRPVRVIARIFPSDPGAPTEPWT